ncbi:DDE-type integrase/transposase/recombinase, partial [Saccharothrix xinjiangensis]
YCAVVLDVHSRRVVGWSIDSGQTAAPATNALGTAISNRSPLSDTVIHSDHGVQGAFNWSSQHPLMSEVVDHGGGGLEEEDQRCAGGCASAVARGSGAAARDALARAA